MCHTTFASAILHYNAFHLINHCMPSRVVHLKQTSVINPAPALIVFLLASFLLREEQSAASNEYAVTTKCSTETTNTAQPVLRNFYASVQVNQSDEFRPVLLYPRSAKDAVKLCVRTWRQHMKRGTMCTWRPSTLTSEMPLK